MTTDVLTCEIHGQPTRISCVDCNKPICPKCLVRTEVGTKCEACARPVAPKITKVSRFGPAQTIAMAGLGLVIVAALVVFLLSNGNSSSKPPAAVKPVGSWSSQPGLSGIRGTATVVRLADGKVLAAGGGVSSIPLATAELFDPASKAWSATGSLLQARRGAAAVVLRDGRVLVAGGVAGPRLLSSAELYDPATGRWTATGAMSIPRLGGTLTLLPDGDVLAAGGTTSGGRQGTGGGQTISPTASAEIYRTTTGTWVRTRPMASSRFEATATSLTDGRVLIVGGLGGAGTPGAGGIQYRPLPTAEIYDPAVGAFTATADMIAARAEQVALRLNDGSVLVAGGLGGPTGDVSLSSAERFDPNTGKWEAAGSLHRSRAGAAAVLLDNGQALVIGGEDVQEGSHGSLASAELYDPVHGAWLPAGSMSCPRSGLAAVVLGDGSVLAIAGDGAFPGQPPVAQSCVDRYSPA